MALSKNLITVQPGDYIWCKYTVTTANTVGMFTDLATKNDSDVASNLLPTSGTLSTTPSGYFRFNCVGEDYRGRKKFVADRCLQSLPFLTTNGGSYGQLNQYGLGSGKYLTPDQGYSTKVAMPSGYTASTNGRGVAFSPITGKYLAMSPGVSGTVSGITVYSRTGDAFSSIGESSRTALSVGNVYRMEFSPDDNFLAICGSASPYLRVLTGSDFTTDATIVTAPAQQCASYSGCSFSPTLADGNKYFIVGQTAGLTPWHTLYQITGTTFTKITSKLNVNPTGTVAGTAFSPDGKYLAVAGSAPFLAVYDCTTTPSWTKITDTNLTTNQPSLAASGVSFSSDSKYMVVSGNGETKVFKCSDWSVVYTCGAGERAVFSSDVSYLFTVKGQVNSSVSPFPLFSTHSISPTGVFTNLNLDTPTIPGAIQGIATSPVCSGGTDQYLIVANSGTALTRHNLLKPTTPVLYNKSFFNISMRLLSGGISAAEAGSGKDTEWDKYIVNDTYGFTWNAWGSGVSSTLTSSRCSDYTKSVCRGGSSLANYDTSVLITAAGGFRPVLIVEVGTISKFFIQDGDNYYTVDSGGNAIAVSGGGTEENFIDFGMDDLTKVTKDSFNGMSNPKFSLYKTT